MTLQYSPLIEEEWIENQSITFDDGTPAKTVEGKGTIDLAANDYKKVVVQADITFGASADGNATVRVRSSSNSGTAKDTILYYSFEVPFTVSTQKRISFEIKEVPYLEIGIYNGNSAAEDITIAAKYAALRHKKI